MDGFGMLSNGRMCKMFIKHNRNKLVKLIYCYHVQYRNKDLTPLQLLAIHVGVELSSGVKIMLTELSPVHRS